ncbi:hypothetical protein [Caulobacter hibisci]|uniref:Uncharacterized protein n=1 Tax=Caulobacter hibisci TaxID=2035993 RepID=A0ABS0STX5_9CAUL|nr:hypothetical protein [Caulobacter hibisci]MBI1683074.1 hypothetical protein [Caulobacter hibisci]
MSTLEASAGVDDFTTTDCGSTNGTANGNLSVGDAVSINNNQDLSSCIVGNSEGKVYGIRLVPNSGIYSYRVDVDAQGPAGIGSGSINLAFTDKTGDTYKLAITSSRRSEHTVSYNSDNPTIVKITWST